MKQDNPNATVIVDMQTFTELVQELAQCRDDKARLKKANDFLNKQIEEYNDKFVKEKNEN